TRIANTVPGSTLIYNVFQNAGRSYNTGIEMVLTQELSNAVSVNLNLNGYRNQINAFTVMNRYPVPTVFSAETQSMFSGNVKLNTTLRLPRSLDVQLTAIYLAPDLIPQGRIGARFSLDAGVKKTINKGRDELFLNATDLLNTMVIRRTIEGQGFGYTSNDYYETQVIRVGYTRKF
ncbi:MAG: outer membrane beta-barrel family protein, partial [Bacteroidetes bacterium]|nr:outer membrane beta-barrel family protein [Bacteroidota bacterium]